MTKSEAITIISDIRSEYNCFEKDEEPKYHALSMAIEALRENLGLKKCSPIGEIEDCGGGIGRRKASSQDCGK